MKQNNEISTAFVSTNSIVQGEQVGILWPELFNKGISIFFAHRTFQWDSEGRGKAAVHCVIIGYSITDKKNKIIFDYENAKADAHSLHAVNINPYLVDAPNVFLPSRISTPDGLPRLIKGSQPTDGGHLILDEKAKTELIQAEPMAKNLLRPYIRGTELINGGCRW
jgi:hypothetical protein